MKQLTVRDIQRLSLEILAAVDKICQNNGINYSLGYGTLIGAVRHKGCIPWDDDIDIIIPRPDYNKFLEIFSREAPASLKVFAPELGNNYFCITRVCEMAETRVRKYYQWSDEETGVWIDVFPIDGVPEAGTGAVRDLTAVCYYACGVNTPMAFDFSLSRNLKCLAKKILRPRLDRKVAMEKYVAKVLSCDYDSATLVSNYASPYEKKDIHRKEVFSEFIRVPFEDQEVSIIANYDEYLTKIYGDYMTPPPAREQVRGHSDNKYYWRNPQQ